MANPGGAVELSSGAVKVTYKPMIFNISHPPRPKKHPTRASALWMRDYFAPQGSVLPRESQVIPPGFSQAIAKGMSKALAGIAGWQRTVLLARAREGAGEEDLVASLRSQDNFTEFDVETLAHLLLRDPFESFPLMTDEQLYTWLVQNDFPSPPSVQETTSFMQQQKERAEAEIQLALRAANIDPQDLWRYILQDYHEEEMSDEND